MLINLDLKIEIMNTFFSYKCKTFNTCEIYLPYTTDFRSVNELTQKRVTAQGDETENIEIIK